VLPSPGATGGGFGGLSPPNKAPSPQNWNMKHYKSVKFLSNLIVKPRLHKLEALYKETWPSHLVLVTLPPPFRRPWLCRSVEFIFLWYRNLELFFFRPRGLAVGCIIMTFGFAFLALPQFIGGRYEFDDISTNSSQGNRSLQITCEERLVNIVSYWFVYKMLFISRIMPIYPRLKIYAPCASCSNSIYCSYFPAEMNLSKASRGCCNLGYMYPL